MEAREHRDILRAAQEGKPELVGDLLRNHIGAFVARNFPEPSAD
jgi:DNA-binding GntR family transcriptional regulator